MEKMGKVDSVPESQAAVSAERVTTDRRDQASQVAGKYDQQKHQMGIQCDITRRKYEIAAWLQEVNGNGYEAAKAAGLTEEEWLALQQEEAEKAESSEDDDKAFDEAKNSIDNLEKMLERIRERQKKLKEQKNQTKKKLNYSYRKVSTSIQGAKTLTQASRALASANTNLSAVRRKAATGQYSDKEIAAAKVHAQKMVRTAKRKVRNIKSEASQAHQNKGTKSRETRKVNQVQERAQHQKMEQKLILLQKKLKSEELLVKNRHRRRENWDLMQADLEYLRRYIDHLREQEESAALRTEMQSQTPVTEPDAAAAGASTIPQGTQEAQAKMDAALAEAAVGAGQGMDITV